jgi:hypothetical protein
MNNLPYSRKNHLRELLNQPQSPEPDSPMKESIAPIFGQIPLWCDTFENAIHSDSNTDIKSSDRYVSDDVLLETCKEILIICENYKLEVPTYDYMYWYISQYHNCTINHISLQFLDKHKYDHWWDQVRQHLN